MHTSLKRVAAVTGSMIIAASAALVGASTAQADGNYYGAWTLTAYKIDGVKIDCPGKLPLPPPAPAISCKGGETLELKTNYRYKTTLSAFKGNNAKGSFDVIKFSSSNYHTIVFDSDAEEDDPRAYKLKLQGMGSGSPKKMTVFLGVALGGGKVSTIKMIFRRDAN